MSTFVSETPFFSLWNPNLPLDKFIITITTKSNIKTDYKNHVRHVDAIKFQSNFYCPMDHISWVLYFIKAAKWLANETLVKHITKPLEMLSTLIVIAISYDPSVNLSLKMVYYKWITESTWKNSDGIAKKKMATAVSNLSNELCRIWWKIWNLSTSDFVVSAL